MARNYSRKALFTVPEFPDVKTYKIAGTVKATLLTEPVTVTVGDPTRPLTYGTTPGQVGDALVELPTGDMLVIPAAVWAVLATEVKAQ